jgi:hypothetical protein
MTKCAKSSNRSLILDTLQGNAVWLFDYTADNNNNNKKLLKAKCFQEI